MISNAVIVFQVCLANVTTIQENEGIISRPNFLLNENDGKDIHYSLAAPEDNVILLKFINFVIEDASDVIKVSTDLCFLK